MKAISEAAFKKTCEGGMNDITTSEIDDPVDIWEYVQELVTAKIIASSVLENQVVEKVYRNQTASYDHILLPTEKPHIFLVIIVDLKEHKVFGHSLLDLEEKYGV
jgi:hypothetical protein